MTSSLKRSLSQRYLLFTVDGSYYAATVSNIIEIGRVPEITPVPNMPEWLPGLINLRGEILSMIDMRDYLGIKDSNVSDDNRLIVVKTQEDDVTTSLIVDRVSGFIQLDTSRKENKSLPQKSKFAAYIDGIYEFDGIILAIMDIERLLQSPEISRFD